jgi:protein KTI12
VDHALNADTFVILDSLNYIKGYRYELYCLARSQRTPHCVVHIDCSYDVSLTWNTTEFGDRWPLNM